MFPLKERKIGGYRFLEPTFYGTKHTGVDYKADYVEYYAPFDGVATSGYGLEGGNFWTLTTGNHKFTARHLSKILKTGQVKEGDLVAITGNTGKYTTNPHLHQEAYKDGKLVDPEIINWNPMTKFTITVVANNNKWQTLIPQIQTLRDWLKNYSSGRLDVNFNIVNSSFTNIPLAPFAGKQAIDINWYRENITPLALGEATLLLLNPEDYKNGTTFGFMTYGDPGRPVRMEVLAQENEIVDGVGVFVPRAFHEICHMLFFLCDVPDVDPDDPNNSLVHKYLFQNPAKNKELLDLVNYSKLAEKLKTIQHREKIKIRNVGWNDAEKGLYFPFDTPERQQMLIGKLTELFPDYEFEPQEYNLGIRPW